MDFRMLWFDISNTNNGGITENIFLLSSDCSACSSIWPAINSRSKEVWNGSECDCATGSPLAYTSVFWWSRAWWCFVQLDEDFLTSCQLADWNFENKYHKWSSNWIGCISWGIAVTVLINLSFSGRPMQSREGVVEKLSCLSQKQNLINVNTSTIKTGFCLSSSHWIPYFTRPTQVHQFGHPSHRSAMVHSNWSSDSPGSGGSGPVGAASFHLSAINYLHSLPC